MQANKSNRVFFAAIVVTLAGVCLFLWFRKRQTSDDNASSPQHKVSIDERIATLMDAAAKGDIETYDACFVKPAIREGLDPALRETMQTSRAATLKATHAELTGFAKTPPHYIKDDSEALVTLEKTFPEHNETFRLRLRNIDGDWKIAKMTPVKKHAPQIKYGTPVVPKAKEEN